MQISKGTISVGYRGVTLPEMVIAVGIFAMFMAIGSRVFTLFIGGKHSENLSKRLVLQMEARKAIINLYRELQQGIEIVAPPPGMTLSHLVFKDSVNNVRMVYLVEDTVKSKEEGVSIYRAMTILRDPGGATIEEPRCLMEHVLKLNFTTYNYGGVLVTTQLRGGKGDYSLVSYVRLQNVTSEEEL